MKLVMAAVFGLIAAQPVLAQDHRESGAHEHGVGQLDIAFDGDQIAMAFRAPGADIVGFEYPAESATDLAAIATATDRLSQPLALFVLPVAAECSVTQADAGLAGEDHETDHDDGEDADHDETHAMRHTEFQAEYLLTCQTPSAAGQMEMTYFAAFPNARELDVRVVSDHGAEAFRIGRAAPVLPLEGHMSR